MKSLNWILALVLTLFAGSAHARMFQFKSQNYKEAKKAENFLRFDMSSTKFGLITTSFQGFAKNFQVSGELKGGQILSGAAVEFSVRDLDTDIDARNEKMWDLCLEEKKYPKIKLSLKESVPLSGETVQIPAVIELRGYEKPIMIGVQAAEKDQAITISLHTELSIKDLAIPDPSIAVASVKDKIEVHGNLVLKSGAAD